MQHFARTFTRLLQLGGIALVGLFTYFGVGLVMGERPVHALPEYAVRTGEPCATCHVSAGGGGPRTLRGLLWAARGRPDQVPELPGQLIAPGIEGGLELYDIACAGCHGFNGEGLFGISLVDRGGISPGTVRSFILNGIPDLGMPAFAERFTPEQLQALTAFVADLTAGNRPPDEYPLPTPAFTCQPVDEPACGGE
jgi:mono/diheme cytochrome c family protein